MLASSVVGAQFGTRLGAKIPSEYLRAGLSIMVLSVVIQLALNLFITPHEQFSVITVER